MKTKKASQAFKLVSQNSTHPVSWADQKSKAPLLVVPHTVLFPNNSLPLGSLHGLNPMCLQNMRHEPLRVVIATRLNNEGESPAHIPDIATEATVSGILTFTGGSIGLIVKGVRRVYLHNAEPDIDEAFQATYSEMHEVPYQRTVKLLASIKALKELAEKFARMGSGFSPEVTALIYATDEPSVLCDLVSQHLSLSPAEKLTLLANLDPKARLAQVMKALSQELNLSSISIKIQESVKNDFKDHIRRNFLREQMHAIKKELGEGEKDGPVDEHEDLEKELQALTLDPKNAKTVRKEFERLTGMMPGTPEYMVSWNYLQWIKDLPWKEPKPQIPDLDKAQSVLDKQHFGMEKIKDKILDFLAVLVHKKSEKGQILLLSGPPGVGKTSIAKSIAKAMKRPFVKVALGGVKDEAEVRGHRRTYIGAMPGKILMAMKDAKAKNPIILLDEIDKVGIGHTHDLSSALLEVLDPEQNKHFNDHYLAMEFDLSNVLFIATANQMREIPGPLLDRMEVVEVTGYTEQEKVKIASRYIIPQIRKKLDLKVAQFKLSDETISHVIRSYTREAGVRQLQRELNHIARKVIRDLLKKNPPPKIDSSTMKNFLGRPKYMDEPKDENLAPGVAIGLAYTSVGGDILYIESRQSQGGEKASGGRLLLTGSLGKVMQESAQTALSYLLSKADILNVPREVLERANIHLHLPDGATPKDGPSAGVAIMCALTGLFLGKSIPSHFAMTGEITLRGQVLPVGGIKEKVLAAHRYNKSHILLPKANWSDLEDLPQDALMDLNFYPISFMEEALTICGLLGDNLSSPPQKFVKQ